MTTQDHLFKISDTGLATYLILKDFRLLSIDYTPVRFEFAFENSQEIKDLSDDYIAGRARTDPASFLRVNKKLLRVIHQKIQWEEG